MHSKTNIKWCFEYVLTKKCSWKLYFIYGYKFKRLECIVFITLFVWKILTPFFFNTLAPTLLTNGLFSFFRGLLAVRCYDWLFIRSWYTTTTFVPTKITIFEYKNESECQCNSCILGILQRLTELWDTKLSQLPNDIPLGRG